MPAASCATSHMASLKSNTWLEFFMSLSPHLFHVGFLSPFGPHPCAFFYFKKICFCFALLFFSCFSFSFCFSTILQQCSVLFLLCFFHGSLSFHHISDTNTLQSLPSLIITVTQKKEKPNQAERQTNLIKIICLNVNIR